MELKDKVVTLQNHAPKGERRNPMDAKAVEAGVQLRLRSGEDHATDTLRRESDREACVGPSHDEVRSRGGPLRLNAPAEIGVGI